MRKFATALICLVALVTLKCGGIPPTYYYRVDYTSEPAESNNHSLPATVGVASFQADVLFESDKIVYRKSPYEVQFYNYRRWIAPPKKIVTENVIRQMKNSGAFQNVVKVPTVTRTDYILRGKIQAFEEWDEGDKWFGVVALDFKLHATDTDEIVWEKLISERTPVQKKEPVAVVEAISESLNHVVENAITGIRETLQMEQM